MMVGDGIRNLFVASVVCQPRTADIDRLRAVIVKLDEVHQRRVRVREEFVDHHVAQGFDADRFQSSRRSVNGVARCPRGALAFPVAWPRQHQRVSRAVRRYGPRRPALVVHLQQHEIVVVAQPDSSAIVRQIVRERPEHALRHYRRTPRAPGHGRQRERHRRRSRCRAETRNQCRRISDSHLGLRNTGWS